MPKRIQRKRVKGWRLPEGAVDDDRASKWGNPWRVGEGDVATRADAAEEFGLGLMVRRIILAATATPPEYVEASLTALKLGDYPSDEEIRAELAGKDLACPCPLPPEGGEDHCHADVLLEMANQEVASC